MAAGLVNVAPGQCRLVRDSSSQISLQRFRGKWLPIKLSADWIAHEIPATAPVLANTGLTAATLYYIYAYDSSDTLTLEASTTAYAVDADTGVYIKSGDATRTLVGMVYMGAGSPGTFVDSATQRFLLNWFNRLPRSLVNGFTAARTTTSATYVEINTEIRCEFLVWADESVRVGANLSVRHSDTHGFVSTAIAFDGATAEDAANQDQFYTATGEAASGLWLSKAGLSEGYHFATLAGATPAGTATWQGASVGALGNATARTSLSVEING